LTSICQCLRDTGEERKFGSTLFAVQPVFVSKSERMRSPNVLAVSCENFENEKMSSPSSIHIKRRRLQRCLINSFDSKPTTELYSCSFHSDNQPDADP